MRTFSGVSSPSLLGEYDLALLDTENMRNVLLAGVTMNKHRRGNTARRRFLVCSNTFDRLIWARSRRNFFEGTILNSVMVGDMVEIRKGFDRKSFRANLHKPDQKQCCFTVICQRRTVELETDTPDECEMWVTALRYIMSTHQYHADEAEEQADEDASETDDVPAPLMKSISRSLKSLFSQSKMSDQMGTTNDEGESKGKGAAIGSGRRKANRRKSLAVTMTSSAAARGQVLALEERYDAVNETCAQLRQQVQMLSRSCSWCCDLLWEAGGRDVVPSSAAPDGEELKDGDGANGQWKHAFRTHAFMKNVPPWDGPASTDTAAHDESTTRRPLGPLEGRTPVGIREVEVLTGTMMRVMKNFVDGRVDEALTRNDSPAPRFRSGSSRTADVFEAMRKAILQKLDRDMELRSAQAELHQLRTRVAELEAEVSQSQQLTDTIASQSPALERLLQQILQKRERASHQSGGGRSDNLSVAETFVRVEDWVQSLSSSLPMSLSIARPVMGMAAAEGTKAQAEACAQKEEATAKVSGVPTEATDAASIARITSANDSASRKQRRSSSLVPYDFLVDDQIADSGNDSQLLEDMKAAEPLESVGSHGLALVESADEDCERATSTLRAPGAPGEMKQKSTPQPDEHAAPEADDGGSAGDGDAATDQLAANSMGASANSGRCASPELDRKKDRAAAGNLAPPSKQLPKEQSGSRPPPPPAVARKRSSTTSSSGSTGGKRRLPPPPPQAKSTTSRKSSRRRAVPPPLKTAEKKDSGGNAAVDPPPIPARRAPQLRMAKKTLSPPRIPPRRPVDSGVGVGFDVFERVGPQQYCMQ